MFLHMSNQTCQLPPPTTVSWIKYQRSFVNNPFSYHYNVWEKYKRPHFLLMHGIDSTRQKFDVDIRTRFRLIVFSIIPYNQQSRYNRIISITITADLADANLDLKPKFLSTARQKSRPRFKRRTNVHLLSLYTYSVACHQPFLQGRSWHCQYLCQHMRRH